MQAASHPKAEPPQPGNGKDKDPDCGAARKHTEELLDEALAESFPASDPPSIPAPPDKCS